MTCDELLSAVGECGYYQRRLLSLFILPVCFYIPLAYLTLLMQLTVPDHWCHVPGRPEGVSLDQWRNITVPRIKLPDGTSVPDKCQMFPQGDEAGVWLNDYEETGIAPVSWNVNGTMNLTVNATECQHGWEFDRSDFTETAPSAFLWVCDQAGRVPQLLSIVTLGNLLGSIIFGALSDRLGRRLLLFLVATLLPAFSVIAVLVVDPVVFFVMRVLAALCYPALYQLVFTLGMEFIGVSWRTCYAVVTSMAFTLGMCAIPLFAYLVNNWMYLGLATSLPALLIIPCFWLVDESPRWLVSRGRLADAVAVLRKMAAANDTSPGPTEQLLLTGNDTAKPTADTPGLWRLLAGAGRRLICKAVALTACWVTNVIMYYGLMLNFSDMSGNLFLNFFLLSLVELPSNVLALYLCNRFGRRPTQLLFFCLSGASMLCVIPLKFVAGSGGAVTALLMVGKFCTSLTFVVLYLQTAELYPTCVRSLGTGVSSLVGIGAGALTPFILHLGKHHPTFPFVVFGGLGVLGALSVYQLPETGGRPLPETMEDAERY